MAESLSVKHNMIMAETSAKTGDGIQDLFRGVAERIVKMKFPVNKSWKLLIFYILAFVVLYYVFSSI